MNQVVIYKKRASSSTEAFAIESCRVLANGGNVGLYAITEDDTGNSFAERIKRLSGIEVDLLPQYVKHPTNNMSKSFDQFGECIGVDILPQTYRFTGWIFKPKKA